MGALVRNAWYVGTHEDGTVAVYRGVTGDFLGLSLHELVATTSVMATDLPEATQHQLADGISVANEEEARNTVERYRDQIDADKTKAAEAAKAAQDAAGASQEGETLEGADNESGDSTPDAAAQAGQIAQNNAQTIADDQSTLTLKAGE